MSWLRMAMLLAALVAGSSHAAPLDERRSELQTLREQIRALQKDMAQAEEEREDAADELAGVERDISAAQRRLREIQERRRAADAEVTRLAAEQKRLQAEVDAHRQRLGETLYRLYVEGGKAGARRMLSGDDPNQLARDAYYLEQIARQRAQSIEEARVSLRNLQDVIAEARVRRAEIVSLEAERARERKNLLEQREKHRVVLSGAAERLRAQRREMRSLQQNEARLEKLLKGLEKIARDAERKAAADAARRARTPVERGASPPMAKAPPPPATPGGFAALRGRLPWPVRGELIGRFGAQRADGGTSWRGIFIRASGGEVRAVAAGRVVFADWLRGFGNLIIVDHGEEYLSIYGNNEALFASPGQNVRAGEAIAGVGASGGAEESGVYFEIRHRGQPQDPARWLTVRQM